MLRYFKRASAKPDVELQLSRFKTLCMFTYKIPAPRSGGCSYSSTRQADLVGVGATIPEFPTRNLVTERRQQESPIAQANPSLSLRGAHDPCVSLAPDISA